jgi:hypothetical protein
VKQATLPCRNRYRRRADTSGHTAKKLSAGATEVVQFTGFPARPRWDSPMPGNRSAQATTAPERYGKTRKISGRRSQAGTTEGQFQRPREDG